LCREEASDLCNIELLQGPDAPPVIGIVKEEEEVGSSELGIREFETDYFCGPLFLDTEREMYKQLGERKISIPLGSLLRPWKIWQGMKDIGERTKAKGIQGNMQGDGRILGGIVVVGPSPSCDVLYSYLEETGKPIPVDDISSAVVKAGKLAMVEA